MIFPFIFARIFCQNLEILTHCVPTRSSEGLERLNERRLLEIRSADLDRSLEIFSCTSFLRPFILWAKAKDGLEVVEDELEAAVGGRTCNNKIKKKLKKKSDLPMLKENRAV